MMLLQTGGAELAVFTLRRRVLQTVPQVPLSNETSDNPFIFSGGLSSLLNFLGDAGTAGGSRRRVIRTARASNYDLPGQRYSFFLVSVLSMFCFLCSMLAFQRISHMNLLFPHVFFLPVHVASGNVRITSHLIRSNLNHLN